MLLPERGISCILATQTARPRRRVMDTSRFDLLRQVRDVVTESKRSNDHTDRGCDAAEASVTYLCYCSNCLPAVVAQGDESPYALLSTAATMLAHPKPPITLPARPSTHRCASRSFDCLIPLALATDRTENLFRNQYDVYDVAQPSRLSRFWLGR